MSEKIYVRKVERYTVWQATEPVEIDVDKLRQCEPPYEGNSNEELWDYLTENVYSDHQGWDDVNKDIYGEDESWVLCFQDAEYLEPYTDNRSKWEDSWFEMGVPNPEYIRVGSFEPFHNNMPKDQW